MEARAYSSDVPYLQLVSSHDTLENPLQPEKRDIELVVKNDTPVVSVSELPSLRLAPNDNLGQESYLNKKNREVVGSQAFNLEYDSAPTDQELFDDVIAYLGEYRLQVQKFNYNLAFSSDGFSSPQIRDTNKGESMRIKALRSIEERMMKGLPVHREQAEEQGLAFLEAQLQTSQDGDTILWGSPPGPKEQGYGDYGFLFYGKVSQSPQGSKDLTMTAIRVDTPTLMQYNAALSDLTGNAWAMHHADEFLATPVVLDNTIDEYTLDTVLNKHFSFQLSDEERTANAWILNQLQPAVNDFIQLAKYASKKEKIKAFHALENYALELKETYTVRDEAMITTPTFQETRLTDIVDQYGFEPPKAAGSCGETSTTDSVSNNPLAKFDVLKRTLGKDNDGFVCPKCSYEAVGPVGNQCPGCGLTKEQFAKDGGIVC